MYDYRWKPYLSVAERRSKAERAIAGYRKKGESLSPVVLRDRAIAKTFWGKSWCDNLERYSDYSNRLPRGRSYLRNGSLLDLRIAAGEVTAQVMGSSLYTVKVKVSALQQSRWNALCKDCAGAIDSLVELLQGRFSKGVMERICKQETGLFPSPKEISLDCSCPDWASMCKHVAAVLYGVGARLDEKPELLFALRKVDEKDLIATAGRDLPLSGKKPASGKILLDSQLAGIFGIEMAPAAARVAQARAKAPKRKQPASPAGKSATRVRKAVARPSRVKLAKQRRRG